MIFEDPSRKRWQLTLGVFALLCIVALGLFGMSVASIVTNPPLPALQAEAERHRTALQVSQMIHQTAKDVRHQRKTTNQKTKKPNKNASVATTTLGIVPKGDSLVLAYLVQEDPDSLHSFEKHKDQIDVVSPNWFFVNSTSCQPDVRINPNVEGHLSGSNVAVIPMLTNGDDNGWHKKAVQAVLHDPKLNACLADAAVQAVSKDGLQGLNVDIEELDDADHDVYLQFLSHLSTDLHAANKKLIVNLSADELNSQPEDVAAVADAVMVMAYDEHYSSGQPGPIASYNWYQDTRDSALDSIPPGKLIMGMGAYGYDWTLNTKQPAAGLKYSEIMSLAADVEANPGLDSDSRNMYFGYEDESNRQHMVWFLDGIADWNLWKAVQEKPMLGVGIWRLGMEDQNLWKYLGDKDATTTGLATVDPLDTVNKLEDGELIKLIDKPSGGKIDFKMDTDGTIDEGEYTTVPTGYVMGRVGWDIPEKQLILTFDDGPDPTWTPKIMQVLSDLKVPATFFVVGDQAQKFPGLVSEMARKGFLVGNHTYLHPNMARTSPERIKLEVNSTQRIIEAAYGKRSLLFRAPYDTDSMPTTGNQLKPLEAVSDLGYVIVGANIDSDDWRMPGVSKIVENVETEAKDNANHIIVMHDAGGDRSQTVAALKVLIPKLRAEGYTFVSLDKGVDMPLQELMPDLPKQDMAYVDSIKIVDFLRHWVWAIIVFLFFTTTILAILRILFMGYLALRGWWRQKPNPTSNIPGKVSVLIPAYNEEKTIAHTLHSLQQTKDMDYEIVVIDDGSTDKTYEVASQVAASDPRIRVVTKPNGGKASALNVGFEQATCDVVVTIDADTVLLPDTLRYLAVPMADSNVQAVSGNVVVGNVNGFLTGFQALEYITAQNFDRRAFDEINAISVVPGATGAWRRQKVIELGGYNMDTLAEDTDLTMRLLASGGKIVYAPQARSMTEAPETIRSLYKQRFRWSFGTFQCLFKNKDQLFKGTLGRIAMPNIFLFQIVFPLLAPIGDFVFILAIVSGDWSRLVIPYITFTLLDLIGSVFAFILDKGPKRLLWLVLVQRFFYRQFMYVVIWRTVIAIMRGRKHGWNKLKRLGNVIMTG